MNAGIEYGILLVMAAKKDRLQKTTIVLPIKLLERAQNATGEGVAPTIRLGLELVAARGTYKKLRSMRGVYRSKIDINSLRQD